MKPQIELVLILGFSILLHILSAWGSYHYRRHPDVPSFLWVREKIPAPILSGVYHGIRLLYYIGLPYLALRHGIVPASMMGLGNQRLSMDAVLAAIGLALVALIILSIAWSNYLRSSAETKGYPMSKHTYPPVERILDVVSYEVHWAFYRSGPIFWLAGNYYAGSFLGILLIGLEEILNPTTGNALRRPQTAMPVLVRWSIILCMTTIFILTRNLWVTVALHGLLATSKFYTQRAPRYQTPAYR